MILTKNLSYAEVGVGRRSMVVSVSQVFLFFLFLSIYLKIHGAGIVHVAAFLCALLATIRYQNIQRGMTYVVLFLAFVTVQFLYVGDVSKDSVKYVLYMMTNMLTIFAGLALLSNVVHKRTGATLMVIMLAMLGLAVLEVYFGLKPVFDSIRGLYTGDESAYEAIGRDVRQYGQIRPAVFTSEPSSLGNFFGAIWLAYSCIVRTSFRNAAKALSLMALAMFVFRSPTLFGYLSVAPGMILLKNDRDWMGFIYLAFLLSFVALGFPYIWTQRHLLPPGPIYEFFSTGSFFIRQISPLLTVDRAIEVAPIFGLASNFHETSQEVSMVFLSLFFGGYYTPDFLSSMPDRKFSSNAFWELIGTFGIVGVLCFLAILRICLVRFRVRKASAVLLGTLILLINHAGIVLTFSWVPLLLLAYAFMDPIQTRVR